MASVPAAAGFSFSLLWLSLSCSGMRLELAAVETEKDIHQGAGEEAAEWLLEGSLHEADMPFPEGQKQLWGGRKGRTFLRFHLTQRSIDISEYWWLCENLGYVSSISPYHSFMQQSPYWTVSQETGKWTGSWYSLKTAASKDESGGRESLGINLWHCLQYEMKSPSEVSVSQGEEHSWGTGRVPGTCYSDLQSYPEQNFNSIAMVVVDISLPLAIVKD